MDVLEAIVLGAIQGASEWLPISSEAQTMLYMVNQIGMDPDQALTYAFLLHIGTMLAVIVRFRREIVGMFRTTATTRRLDDPLSRTVVLATLATGVSAVPLYFVLKRVLTDFDGTAVNALIGAALMVTGILLYASRTGGQKQLDEVSDGNVLAIGLAQGFAILPGISRSGTTLAALLLSRIEQETALVISFLISVPAVIGVVVLDFGEVSAIPAGTAILLVISSFVVGFASMDLLLRYARRFPFWIFCLTLGAVTFGSAMIRLV